MQLERLNPHRGKQNCVEIEGSLCGAGYPEVSLMRGVETASKEGDTPSPICPLWHGFMVRHLPVHADPEFDEGPIPKRSYLTKSIGFAASSLSNPNHLIVC